MVNSVVISRDPDDRWPTGGLMRFCAMQNGLPLYVDVGLREWYNMVDVYDDVEAACRALEFVAGKQQRAPFSAGSGYRIEIYPRES